LFGSVCMGLLNIAKEKELAITDAKAILTRLREPFSGISGISAIFLTYDINDKLKSVNLGLDAIGTSEIEMAGLVQDAYLRDVLKVVSMISETDDLNEALMLQVSFRKWVNLAGMNLQLKNLVSEYVEQHIILLRLKQNKRPVIKKPEPRRPVEVAVGQLLHG